MWRLGMRCELLPEGRPGVWAEGYGREDRFPGAMRQRQKDLDERREAIDFQINMESKLENVWVCQFDAKYDIMTLFMSN